MSSKPEKEVHKKEKSSQKRDEIHKKRSQSSGRSKFTLPKQDHPATKEYQRRSERSSVNARR